MGTSEWLFQEVPGLGKGLLCLKEHSQEEHAQLSLATAGS